MRPYILAETNWLTVKGQNYELAVLPWGATEAHNYHLPYSADIVDVLNHHGIQKLLIMNSHGGNDFRPIIRELGAQYPKMFMCNCNFYQALKMEDYFDEPGDHAGEMETSLLMYLVPELVLPLDQAGKGKEKMIKIQAFHEGC